MLRDFFVFKKARALKFKIKRQNKVFNIKMLIVDKFKVEMFKKFIIMNV